MFNRGYWKDLAKRRIQAAWGVAVLVALVGMLLGGSLRLQNPYARLTAQLRSGESFGGIREQLEAWLEDETDSAGSNRDGEAADNFFDLDTDFGNDLGAELPDDWDFRSSETWPVIAGILGVLLIINCVFKVLAVLYTIFVGNVIGTGMRGWFLRYSRGENAPFGELFASFRIYLPVVAANFLRSLYTFLWSLLFVIPGIVKSYAYSMTDYIIYENPNLSANQAITLSRELTQGAKWDLFVLDLSFIGWNLLSALTFGLLGILYVNPYYSTAHAMVYDSLKMTAIQSGRLTWADFGQMAPVYTQPMTGGESY